MSKSRLTVFSFVRRFLLRLMVVLAIFWGGGIALFSVAPVPFSAVMVERQVSAWLHGNFRYVAHSDWVSMDQISPWMGLAVIAAEDQKFPEHWGFDVASIEQALAHNERNENRIRGASTISQQTAKNLFLWDGRSWVRKGLEAGLTLGIETVWSKKRILTVYLNIAEFGDGVLASKLRHNVISTNPRANLPGRKLHYWQLYYLIHFVSKSPRHRAMCVAVRRGFYGRCIS